MSFRQLFLRDCVYYRKPFAALSAAACLVCAILLSALLIGDSVRGTLYDNLNRNTSFAKTLVRFPIPVTSDVPESVLHTNGVIAPGIKTHLYAFPGSSQIQGRDAYCSSALVETLHLSIGDRFTVRVQTISPIKSESLMGHPPKLKQITLIYRGIWSDEKADVNFENPQLRSNNLFVNHEFLVQSLELGANAINEIWLASDRANPVLSDAMIWELSQLYFEHWDGRPVLKGKSFFLPEQITNIYPDASKGVMTFAESFSDSDGEHTLDYFFVGAFDGDVFPVAENHAMISETIDEEFPQGGVLTFFSSSDFRKINRLTHQFPHISKISDTRISDELMPSIPGLTDVSDCSNWEAGLPIDMGKIKSTDKTYWETYKSKPKLYLNFAQAQKLFFPGQCNVLIFDKDDDTAAIQQKIVAALRKSGSLYQTINVVETLRSNIDHGIPFAPLFLGLSFFIIVSALLVLAMLLKLHLFDRSEEFRTIADHTSCTRIFAWFHFTEMIAVVLPGIVLGLVLGTLLCQVQLFLLEHVWNGIVLMHRLNFYTRPETFLMAFGITFCCTVTVILLSLRFSRLQQRFYRQASHPIRTIAALATLSFFRRWGQYRLCMLLLILGFLGTLGVGAFGIKSRGEDAFSYRYVAETVLPVIPSHDEPFPPGAIAIRVYDADDADCSNILRAETPTVYGCDVAQLTGDSSFLQQFYAAVDNGSMRWIMQKKLGDTIRYPNGTVTLQRAMKATVFQRGILVENTTFAQLFPDVQGARFFLIRDDASVEAYRKYLSPYGVTIMTTDAFMAQAESFQNRYLTIFLQLGLLGFVLGIGSLLLLMVRNLHAQRNEIIFLSDLGFSQRELFSLYYFENLWLYLASAVSSLIFLCVLAMLTQIHLPTLLAAWGVLTVLGVVLIYMTLRCFFRGNS